MTRNTTASVTGMAMATTAPGRTPSNRKLTTRMIPTACQSDAVKSPMARSTTAGWSEIRIGSIPTGRFEVACTMARLTSVPSSRISPPAAMEMARAMAGLPSTRSIGCGGSTSARRTVAISPSRIVRPFATSVTSSTSASEVKAPDTRRARFSLPELMTPDGRTTFCAAMALKIWP